MSARNLSRNEVAPTPQLSPRQIDSACRRLARVPNKKLNPKNFNDSPDNFASNYFAQNPDTPLDKRSPQEKLDEINSKLQDLDLEENDRFSILVQKKAICSLAFGDVSPESFEALTQLGSFYNTQHRPDSALRHLLKAQEIGKTIGATEEQNYALAIEISSAYLNVKPQNNRNLNNAENSLRPYDEYQSEDKILDYKKLCNQAQIKINRKQYSDAYDLYEKSYEALDAANQGRTTDETASLFYKMAECAADGEDPNTALDMYQRAYDTYKELGMRESTKKIKEKIDALKPKVNMLLTEEEEDLRYSRSASSRSSSRAKSKM